MTRERRHRARVSAAGLVFASLSALLAGCSGDDDEAKGADRAESVSKQSASPTAQGPRAPRGSTGREAPRLPDEVTGPILAESVPRVVSIPRIGVTSRLVPLGLEGDGTMEVPINAADAGWYTRGPTPGALGPAVIAGHVAWNGESGVFSALVELREGDRVQVRRGDGTTAVFSVQAVRRFAKAQFPTRAVFGAVDHSALRLITCGGLYDDSTNRYLDNVVAFAELIAVRR